jgi:sporulation protein YlmC with PRC-barrel domain
LVHLPVNVTKRPYITDAPKEHIMMKRLLATTTLAAVLSTAAFAQTAPDATGMEAGEGTPIFQDGGDLAPLENVEGFYTANETLVLAASLIGETVYTGASSDAETVGQIRDIVLGGDGQAQAIVIGVGGFVGLGEKDVAVDFDRISRSVDTNGDVWLVINATQEQLEAAPEFDRSAIDTGNEEQALATDGQAVPADNQATAPVADQTAEGTTAVAPVPADGTDARTNTTMGTADTLEADERRVPISEMTLSADRLMGLDVYSVEGDDIGDISDVLVNAEGGVDGFVIDIGGFLGLGARSVGIGFDNLELIVEGDNDWEGVQTPFTREQLEAQPEFDQDSYTAGNNDAVLRVNAQ